MSKHSAQDTAHKTSSLRFVDFWLSVAQELGSSRLDINHEAHSIKSIFAANSDHRDYLREVVRQSYLRSQCKKLSDAIDLHTVLDILGETAFELKGQQADDLMDIELLEEIAWVISQRYAHHIVIQADPDTSHAPTKPAARLISLSKIKTRRANRRL